MDAGHAWRKSNRLLQLFSPRQLISIYPFVFIVLYFCSDHIPCTMSLTTSTVVHHLAIRSYALDLYRISNHVILSLALPFHNIYYSTLSSMLHYQYTNYLYRFRVPPIWHSFFVLIQVQSLADEKFWVFEIIDKSCYKDSFVIIWIISRQVWLFILKCFRSLCLFLCGSTSTSFLVGLAASSVHWWVGSGRPEWFCTISVNEISALMILWGLEESGNELCMTGFRLYIL